MIQAPANFLSANAKLAKQPIYLVSITGYARALTNYPTAVAGQYDWIERIEDHQITVSDMDGGADLADFQFTVTDVNGLLTADFPNFLFEGKAITVKTGFPGMSQSDFVTLFTGVIDHVDSANQGASYTFVAIDNKQILTKVIYTVADDGLATDSAHRKTLLGHPLDILVSILTTQLGLAKSQINVAKIYGYRDSIFAGMTFSFSLDSPPAAKDFIEHELMKPLGGYIWVNSLGQVDANFFAPQMGPAICAGCLIGAWTDGTGQLVANPFLIGYGVTLTAPPGATQLQMGMNDDYYTDNAGSWYVDVTDATTGAPLGASVGVLGSACPWKFTGGINAAYPFTNTGVGLNDPTVVTGITAGHSITVTYVSGTASILGFTDLGGPLGDGAGFVPTASDSPGIYAFSVPPVSNPFVLNPDNTVEIPDATQAALINVMSFRFDEDPTSTGKYLSETVQQYAASISKYGQFGQHVVESKGMRAGLQGYFLAASTARLVFLRYGDKNLLFSSSGGSASSGGSGGGTDAIALWTACVLEPGDLVAMTNPFVPDRKAGVKGITAKILEVLDRTWNFEPGTVTLALLDSGINSIKIAYVAPTGTPVFTSASAYQKNRYMFLCNNSDQQSDATPAQVLA